jgi:hypothetical protein
MATELKAYTNTISIFLIEGEESVRNITFLTYLQLLFFTFLVFMRKNMYKPAYRFRAEEGG